MPFWKKATFCVCMFALLGIGVNIGVAQAESSPNSREKTVNIPSPENLTEEDQLYWRLFSFIFDFVRHQYVMKLSDKEILTKALRGLMPELDPHSEFLSPEEMESWTDNLRKSFGGVGLAVAPTKNNTGIQIVSVVDDAPGARAGILPGDIIVKIETETGTVSTQGMSTTRAVELLRGEVGTAVTFYIRRTEVIEPIKITVVREKIDTGFAFVQKTIIRNTEFGLIRIRSFGREDLATLVKNAITALVEENGGRPLQGLVLDLRGNPGGLLEEAINISNLFLDASLPQYLIDEFGTRNTETAQIFSEYRRGVFTPQFYVEGADVIKNAPLLILVDSGSASASEAVAGILQSHGRALVAGPSETYGKGSVQRIQPLNYCDTDDNCELLGGLRITISLYVVGPGPQGCEIIIQGRGILPDIWLSNNEEGSSNVTRERELGNALVQEQTNRPEQCRAWEVNPEHVATAHEMLKALGLTIGTKPAEVE